MSVVAMSYAWLKELNSEQREAVCHIDGPLLVVAGAGSGKTRTLAYRVAYLIASGTRPERILLLTFTRRSAQEMVRRALAIVARGTDTPGRVWGGTFHSTANRLLRLYHRAASLSPDFTVMDQSDAQDLLDVVRHELGLHSRGKRFPRKATCLAIYSRRVNGVEDLSDVIDRYFSWCRDWKDELRELFRQYVDRKQKRNVLDFDDLLLYLAELLKDPAVSTHISKRFDHVLVDEYQDTNRLQATILKGLRQGNDNIMVVGDDAQSIYSFRAASVDNMFRFPRQFERTRIVTLQQNYRSVAPILESTNLLIRQAKQRYSKELVSARGTGALPKLVTCKDDDDQSCFVVEKVLEHYEQGIPLKRQAILFRSANLSNSLEVELNRRHIPYHKYGGLRFLEASHIKDLLAFLRVAENPRDEIAWFRILQLIEGVGPATAAKILRHVGRHEFNPSSLSTFRSKLPSQPLILQYGQLFATLRSNDHMAPASQIELIRKCFDPMLERLYENHLARSRDLRHLQQIASRYRSRSKFLVDLQLDPPTSTSDLAGPPSQEEDWLILSTIHSAKGGEWDVVFLVHVSDGCLPSDMSTGSDEDIEEELRLAYVAMTRARDFLYVTWPVRYYQGWQSFTDRHGYAQPSRFLTPEVRSSLEELSLDSMEFQESFETGVPSVDLGSRIRSLWD